MNEKENSKECLKELDKAIKNAKRIRITYYIIIAVIILIEAIFKISERYNQQSFKISLIILTANLVVYICIYLRSLKAIRKADERCKKELFIPIDIDEELQNHKNIKK